MRHIDFIFIPDRFPRRVREEISVLKERFHPSLISSPTSTSGENETDSRRELNEGFRSIEKFVTFSSAFRPEIAYRNKNVNLQLRDFHGISLNNRRGENCGGEQIINLPINLK